MRHQMDGSSLRSLLGVLVFSLLTLFCRAQPRLIGSPRPIEAIPGDDVILPCQLKPAMDAVAMTLEWTRSDLDPMFVYLWRARQDYVDIKNPSYRGRTFLSVDELKKGNISLKLTNVTLSDKGRYKCFVPEENIETLVELVVASGAASLPVIDLAGIYKHTGGVVLECRSSGWYPEPEVSWLDAEGNLLSAGRPETVRGPDDLYTVSSRVTVEKRHDGNTFTCRLTQNKTTQTREAHIHISDDFFMVQPDSDSSPIVTGLTVALSVCIVVIIALISLIAFLWKRIVNKNKSKENHQEETETQLMTGNNKTEDVNSLTSEVKKLNEDKVFLTEELEKKNQQLEEQREAEKRLEETNKHLMDENRQMKEKNQQLQTDTSRPVGLHRGANPRGSQIPDQQLNTANPSRVTVDKIDPYGKSIRLRNNSSQSQRMGGWTLTIEVDDNKPVIYTFSPLILICQKSVTIWAQDCCQSSDSSTDLVWYGQKSWNTGEKVTVTVSNQKGEEQDRKCETLKSKSVPGRSEENKPTSTHQISDTESGIMAQVDQTGRYVRLINWSHEDVDISGRTLTVHGEDRDLTYTFRDSLILCSRSFIPMEVNPYGMVMVKDPPSHLKWTDFKSWTLSSPTHTVDVT